MDEQTAPVAATPEVPTPSAEQKPEAPKAEAPKDPRVLELEHHGRILQNVAKIIDAFEIKGVSTAHALLEAAAFIEKLHEQITAQINALKAEAKDAPAPSDAQPAL